MIKLSLHIHLFLLCCLTVGCQQSDRVLVESLLEPEADIQAIKSLFAGLETATNDADLDRYVSIYADDAVMFPPADPPSVGKKAIRTEVQQWFEEYDFQSSYEVVDVEISGIMAAVQVSFLTTITPKPDGEPVEETGNWLWILKKQPEGMWKAIYEMWTNEILIYPHETE